MFVPAYLSVGLQGLIYKDGTFDFLRQSTPLKVTPLKVTLPVHIILTQIRKTLQYFSSYSHTQLTVTKLQATLGVTFTGVYCKRYKFIKNSIVQDPEG